MENKQTGKVWNEEKCIFQAQLESQLRAESQRDGIRADENSTRNEASKGLRQIKEVIGTGLTGMLKSIENRKLEIGRSGDH